jgi:hypothetical protein
VKLSPTATVRAVSRASEPRNVPAVVADQKETCEYCSAVLTFVQAMSAEFVIDPDDAAEHVTAFRVVSVAAFDVPAAPGSPVCNFTQNAAGAVQETLRHRESRIELATPLARPVATAQPST